MFGNLAVRYSEHVEPGRRVLLSGFLRVVVLANERQGDVVALGLDRNEPRQLSSGTGAESREVLEETLEARVGIRVVLGFGTANSPALARAF
jgi:single-stranded DNA-binding protein